MSDALDPVAGSASERIVRAALDRLASAGPAAVRLLVAPGELLKAGLDVSRDSAYRAVRIDGMSPSDAISRAASTRVARDLAWGGASETATEMANSYLDESTQPSPIERLRAALLADIVASFDSPSWPAGFLLHAAAIPCSPRWAGRRPSDDADRQLGEQLIEDRLDHYTILSDLYEPLLHAAMTDIGLRPAGRSIRDVLRLLHAFLDGAVLRMFIDPDLTAEDVADAMLRLGIALGEPGSFADPRRPPDLPRQAVFDRLVASAHGWWVAHPEASDVDVDAVGRAAGAAPGSMPMLLPTSADVADSIIRSMLLIAGDGDDVSTATSVFAPAAAGSLLRRIAAVADAVPQICAAVASTQPTIGSSVDAATARALTALLSPTHELDEIEQLNAAAWRGSASLSAQSHLMTRLPASVAPSTRI